MTTVETLDKRIDALDTKMDARFDALTSKIDALTTHVTDSIDGLAIMMKENFDLMVTKEEFNEKMEEIDGRFDNIDRRFDIIENISLKGHERRIENLEDRVRVVETKTKVRK